MNTIGEFIPTQDIEYLNKELYINGELQIKSFDFFKDIPQNHIKQFCHENGVYCLPTTELIEFLQNEIDNQSAIELGAGHGVIAKHLGIIATDSKLQNKKEVAFMYALAQQPVVKYGDNIQTYDAIDALRRYKPKVAISAWVTHKYNPTQHWREGNMYGVPEEKVLKMCPKYIFIGNKKTHAKKPILDIPHRTIELPFLLSRNMNEQDVVWIWETW